MRREETKNSQQRSSPWIYNTWEPFERHINQATTRQLIEVAGKMGFDIFTIDDGWQQEYGENAVNRQAFPDGLEPIQAAVEEHHMRLGLWVPMAAIGTGTAEYRQHPEWAAVDIAGKPKTTMTAAGSKVVMCLATPYRDLAAERINKLIEQYHLAYVKLDLTTIFNAYGEAPGCWAKGHLHATWAESLGRIYEGIEYITHKIYARHPDVLLDLTFELWGQKHVIDAGLITTGDLDWMSNVQDSSGDSAGPIQARTLLYQRALGMPADAMLIGNLHADVPSKEESFATAIGSSPLLLGDLRKLSAEDQAWYQEKIRWFKELRQKTSVNESFFPLGNWRQPSAADWDGFARFSQAGAGVIALFKNKSQARSAIVTLPLLPPGKFRLRSIITGQDIGLFSSAQMARGIVIPFSREKTVEIVEVNASVR
jgi:alpha-galactosidase